MINENAEYKYLLRDAADTRMSGNLLMNILAAFF